MADATIVAVALDPLTRRFGLPLTAGQEVLALYLVVLTATLPTLGRAGDRFGRREAYLTGFAVFGFGSALAAVAPGFGVLLAGRAVQAAGGALLTAGSLALIAEHAPRGRKGRSIALLVITQAVAGLAAPPIGGVLVVIGGWQAIFWVGLPIAAGGALLTLRFVPRSVEHRRVTIDVAGALLVAGVLLGLGGGISSLAGPVIGDVPTAAWFSIAWLSALVLVPVELHSRRPILDGRLLRRPRFAGAAIASFLSTGTLMSCFALLPFWLERSHGINPVLAGLTFLPIGIGIAAMSRTGGRLGDRGRTRLTTSIGIIAAAAGLAVAAWGARAAQPALLLGGLLVLGCGNGLFSSPNTAAALGIAPPDALGSASGLLSTARNGGVITGLGITGAIYTAWTAGVAARGDAVAAALFAGAAGVCLVVAVIAVVIHRPLASRREEGDAARRKPQHRWSAIDGAPPATGHPA